MLPPDSWIIHTTVYLFPEWFNPTSQEEFAPNTPPLPPATSTSDCRGPYPLRHHLLILELLRHEVFIYYFTLAQKYFSVSPVKSLEKNTGNVARRTLQQYFLNLHMSRFKNTYIYLFYRNSNNSKMTKFLLMFLVTAGRPNMFLD